MIRSRFLKQIAANGLALGIPLCAACAADQAKTIVNSLDPQKLNELIEISARQPDAALTSLAPVSSNKFRFLFIWPSSNPVMTFERVGQSFAERLVALTEQMRLLADGFCLPTSNMYYGTAAYGDGEVNVAYRDIEVHYKVGWQGSCAGRYITIAALEREFTADQTSQGYGALYHGASPSNAPPTTKTPEEGLKPFLNPVPGTPLE